MPFRGFFLSSIMRMFATVSFAQIGEISKRGIQSLGWALLYAG
jgi:hypothetical protein